MERDSHSDGEIIKFYNLKNIAVVGMSEKEGKAAHYVPKYLISSSQQRAGQDRHR